jgi:hypothetical protein
MMNIIGWLAVIYIFIGCGVMMWFYILLDRHDCLDGFIDGICDEFTNDLGLQIGEHYAFIEVFVTLLLINGWAVFIITLIYEKILRSRKDRAN